MWAGSISGGLWLSDNGGGTWSAYDDRMANLAISTMAMDPTNADIIIAGTGESFAYPSIRGGGLFWTRNAGSPFGEVKWAAIPLNLDGADVRYVNRVAISHDGQIALAATEGGLLFSDDPERRRWTLMPECKFGTVLFHPSDASRAIAASRTDGSVYFSTNSGRRWRLAKTSQPWSGRVELAYALANPQLVYASVDMDEGEIWLSSDGGVSYLPRASLRVSSSGVTAPLKHLEKQGDYGNVVWAGDAKDPNLVVVGGIDLWRSTDGGDQFHRISDWQLTPASAHADHHAIVAHPGYLRGRNRIVFFGTDGGIYRADDVHTVGWDQIEGWREMNQGYVVTQFYRAAGASEGPIVAGAQDNGTWLLDRLDELSTWRKIFGGDGGWSVVSSGEPTILYGSSQFLGVFRKIGQEPEERINGKYYEDGKWKWKPSRYLIPDARDRKASFTAPIAIYPGKPASLLAGGNSLWRTNDALTKNTVNTGPEWKPIKDPSTSLSPITVIAIVDANAERIWVCHENGEVYVTDAGSDARPDWSRVDNNGPNVLPKRMCSHIAIDPLDSESAYVAFGGFSYDNLWRTRNRGRSWESITNKASGFPVEPVRSVTVHPARPNWLYAGTEFGLYVSENGGATWSPTNEGPINTAVSHLFWMKDTSRRDVLVAATYGRGLFAITIP
jgi:hypothetical protein